uniref:Uncharacterized protein n=1 Tax=Euplotes crassus TaxID=5936 RepID=A0A7S3P1N0_EUPCR|mmetsp:Transcript_40323/g.39862  ORF Transcript_40323/g.39862 Transcript_40323/m.39862 type:complete len:198 (+) Transcript_40323:1057-1650(+)
MSKEVKMEKIKHSPLARLDISPAPSTIFENVHKNKSRKIKRSNIIKKKHPIKINPGSFQKHKLFSKNRNLGEAAQGKLSQLKNRFTKAQSKIVQRRRNKSTMRNYGTLEGIGGNKTRRFKSPDVSRNNLHSFSRNTTSRNTPSVSPGILESSFLSQKNNGRYLVASPDPSKFFRSPMPHVKTKKEEEKLPNIKRLLL